MGKKDKSVRPKSVFTSMVLLFLAISMESIYESAVQIKRDMGVLNIVIYIIFMFLLIKVASSEKMWARNILISIVFITSLFELQKIFLNYNDAGNAMTIFAMIAFAIQLTGIIFLMQGDASRWFRLVKETRKEERG